MPVACPERLPNGLKLLAGSESGPTPEPQYARDALIAPTPSALRVNRDVLSDTNAAARRLWRLASEFGAVADRISTCPQEAAEAIVEGLIAHCNFDALVAALSDDAARDAESTQLLTEGLTAIGNDVLAIRAELLAHISNVMTPGGCATATKPDVNATAANDDPTQQQVLLITGPQTVAEVVTPAGIAAAAEALHLSMAALIFSPEADAKYAPDSPRRNRGRALIARLHQCQAAFERGTPSATSAAPNAFAASVMEAFRDVASRVTSLSVPSTVDTVAAKAVVAWTAAAVDELERVGREARLLGGAWRRLSLVWVAELRPAADGDEAAAADEPASARRARETVAEQRKEAETANVATAANAVDPFQQRAAFQLLADAAQVAVPKEFDFDCDDARRAADKTLAQIAGSTPIKCDATRRCLEQADQVLSEATAKLAPRWAHAAAAAPKLVAAARDVSLAMGQAAAASEAAVDCVATAQSLLRDPKDVDSSRKAAKAVAAARDLVAALADAPEAAPADGETVSVAAQLKSAAQDIAEWAAVVDAGTNEASEVSTGLVRPALSKIVSLLDGTEALQHTIHTLRSALLTQCMEPAELVPLAARGKSAAMACNAGTASPCAFADAVSARVAAVAAEGARALPTTSNPELTSWDLLGRAWRRAMAAFPDVEPAVVWEAGEDNAKMTVKISSSLAADAIAAAETMAPGMVLDFAVSNPAALDPVPAVADALTLALIQTVIAFNGSDAEGWALADRRVGLAAQLDAPWRFVIFAATLRRLAAAAGDEPVAAAVEGAPYWCAVAVPSAAGASARHPAVVALDRCLEALGALGVDAAHLTSTCKAAILADMGSFAPAAAAAAHEARASGSVAYGCSSCSWWNSCASLAPAATPTAATEETAVANKDSEDAETETEAAAAAAEPQQHAAEEEVVGETKEATAADDNSAAAEGEEPTKEAAATPAAEQSVAAEAEEAPTAEEAAAAAPKDE